MKIYLNTTNQTIIRFFFTFLAEILAPYLLIFGLIFLENIDSFSKITQPALPHKIVSDQNVSEASTSRRLN